MLAPSNRPRSFIYGTMSALWRQGAEIRDQRSEVSTDLRPLTSDVCGSAGRARLSTLVALCALLLVVCALSLALRSSAAADSSPITHNSSLGWLSDRAWLHSKKSGNDVFVKAFGTNARMASPAPFAASYTWNQTVNALWNTSTNWTPSRSAPAVDDILVFNNGATITVSNVPTQTIGQISVGGGTNVTLQAAAANQTLTISGGLGSLAIASGSQLNVSGANVLNLALAAATTGSISGAMTLSGGLHRLTAVSAPGVTFNNNAQFTQDIGCTGNVFGSGTSNSIVFASGSTFIQNDGSNPFQKTQPASVVVFQTGSLFKFQQNSAPSLSGRTYANLEINAAAFSQSGSGGNTLSIDNLTITAGTLNLGMTGPFNLKGNISVASGQTLNFNPASAATISLNGTSAQTISGGGTITQSSLSTIAINNSNGVSLSRPLSLGGTLTLTSGNVTTTSTNLLTISNTAANAISSGSSLSYINGPLARILPASLALGSTYSFPVGKAGFNPFELVNPTTTSGGTVTIQAEEFDGSSGGTAGTGLSALNTNRYWQGSITAGSGNFTNTTARLTDSTVTAANAIGKSATQGGSYDSIGGSVSGSTITSNAFTSFGFFNIGTLPDTTPPVITYTPLADTASKANRALATTITDASGVPTSGGGLPVLYYRKGTSGAYSSNQCTSGGGSAYNCTFNYIVFPGGIVANGDTIQYFVAAQDSAATPNATTNPSTGASGFGVNPPSASTPTTAPNSYTITNTDEVFGADGNLPAGTYHDVTINGCSTNVTLTGNVTITGTFTINGCGNLYTNNFIMSGAGSFVMNAGTWLHVTDANGITSGTTLSGNIQVTGGRTFPTTANYDYDGGTNQVVGNGLPGTVNDLLISTTGGAGNNTVAGNSGQVVTTLLEIIQGVYSSHSTYTDVQIDNAGTLTLAGDSTVSGNWTNNGTFNNAGFKITFNGTVNQLISGSTSTAFATLAISNTGVGGSNTVSLAQNISDTALNITSGVFDQGASFNVASGTVNVSAGATWNDVGNGGVALSGNVANAGTITFNGGTTACGESDSIAITSTGGQRAWTGTGTFNMTDVTVSNQGATPPPLITVHSGTDAGGNGLNWVFLGCTANSYTWTGASIATPTDWTVPTNWSPARTTPDPGDVLTFDNNSSPIVTNIPTQTISRLRIIGTTSPQFSAGANGNILTINAGASATGFDVFGLSVTGSNALIIKLGPGTLGTVTNFMSVAGGAHKLISNDAGGITFPNGSIFSTQAGFSDFPFGDGDPGSGAAGSIIFQSGAAYIHNAGNSPFGGNTASVATFQTGSSAQYLTGSGFDACGRTYADLLIGSNSVAVTASQTGSCASQSFQFDNLTVNNTAGDSSLSYTGTGTITIRGNISSTGAGTGLADVTLTPGAGGILINGGGAQTFSHTNTKPLNFDGNVNIASGTTLTLSRILVLGMINSNSKTVTVASGATLNAGSSGYVVGSLRRTLAAAGPGTFEVGTLNGYSPVDMTAVAGGTFPAVFAASASASQEPHIHGATGNALKRYWTLSEDSGSITADLVFHYLDPTDIPTNISPAFTDANYILFKYDGSFSAPSATLNTAANTAAITGVSSFSNWTLADPSAVTPGTLTFVGAPYSTPEGNSGSHDVTITVSRTGGTDGALDVSYTTSDGTATLADNDYVLASGVLHWIDGETGNKTFTITVKGDTTYEPNETVNITLSPPTDLATITPPNPTTLTILNDDAPPASLVVNTNDDLNNGACLASHCSLREAINAANFSNDTNTITFDSTVFAPAGGPYTITLGSSLPSINWPVNINGPGPTVLSVSGNDLVRILSNFSSGSPGVTISGFALTHGNAGVGSGGAINNSGLLTISNCLFTHNVANQGGPVGNGGAISNAGTLTLTNSTVSSNQSSGAGGGIANNGGTLTVINSTVSDNIADSGSVSSGVAAGGGIFNSGPANITNSAVSGNTASGDFAPGSTGIGGGIYNHDATLNITNSTVSGNTANGLFADSIAIAGGIENFGGTLNLTNSTVSGNTASAPGANGNASGGGLVDADDGGSQSTGTANVRNTIVAGNSVSGTGNAVAPDVSNSFNSRGHNLIGKTDGSTGFTQPTDKTGTIASPLDPKLGPFQSNGGPTQTHALLGGSPALDAGDDCVLNNSCSTNPLGFNLTTDQRGTTRPQGNHVDIGAFELQAFAVNTTADHDDGFCEALSSGHDCTLREAINAANATSGSMITFAIPTGGGGDPGCDGSGVCTIVSLNSLGPLPAISKPIFINGYSQAGAAPNTKHLNEGDDAVLKIELTGGTVVGPNSVGLDLESGSDRSAISGLIINRFPGSGIFIRDSNLNTISGNFIGTDVTGTTAANSPNGAGILITSDCIVASVGNTIGGDVPAARDVISGNGSGIVIGGSNGQCVGSTFVEGNYIGTDHDGTLAIPNTENGVIISPRSQGNTIGCEVLDGDNVISGNSQAGIGISGDQNFVTGNLIGTTRTGLAPLPNSQQGIVITNAGGNSIGSDQLGIFGNLISGNTDDGIAILGGTLNTIQGNFIGTDINGAVATGMGNGGNGIEVYLNTNANANSTYNTIGGQSTQQTRPSVADTKAAAALAKLEIKSKQRIAALKNGNAGRRLTPSVQNASASNVIAGNTGDGVRVSSDGDFSNLISRNSIFSNGGLGINLGTDGVTLNDSADHTNGPNHYQNFPVITSAIVAGLHVTGTLDSTSPSTEPFTIELFNSTTPDPTGYGEGQTFVDSQTATPAGSGHYTFDFTVPTIQSTDRFTVTATDGNGNTSEFSHYFVNPTITATTGLSRQQGSSPSNSQIATVNDAESGPNGVTVTVTSTNPMNGVTISNIVNANDGSGHITANIVAACTASNASFTLTANDGNGGTATDTLNITVTANTAPTLSYNNAAVFVNGSKMINPATGPSDNGSVSTIAVQSQGTYTGTISVNNSTGIVSISNAGPTGSHTITIRATDNCGTTTDTSFTLNVNPCPTSFTVNDNGDTDDANVGDGTCADANSKCTLRAAIEEANALTSCGTIDINFSGVVSPINLGVALPAIAHNVNINGPGANLLTVMRSPAGGTPQFRVFEMQNFTVNISGLTISNGNLGSGSFPTNNGGAIFNNGTATLTNSMVTGNTATSGAGGGSGGIFNNGTLSLVNSTVSGNSATGGPGGGVTNYGVLTLTNSTVSGNNSSAQCGGLYNGSGTTTLTNSTVSGNSAFAGGGICNNPLHTVTLISSTVSGNNTTNGGDGAGILNDGTITMTNSTVSGNHSVGSGGGILNNPSSHITLINCTVSSNTAIASSNAGGGGIYNVGTTNLKNTMVANNTINNGTGFDLKGTFNSEDYNLIGIPAGASFTGTTTHNIMGVDPLLGSLMNNGGRTFTQGLLYNSPALDAGDDCVTQAAHCGDPNIPQLTTDQRGQPRLAGAHVDIGAYERQANESRLVPHPGSNVTVNLNDVTVSFPSTTAARGDDGSAPNGIAPAFSNPTVSITVIDPAGQPAPPSGYAVGNTFNPPLPAFDVSTTATYTPPVGICFYLPSITDPSFFAGLKVLHNESGVLVDPGSQVNFGAKLVCAHVSSLSPFVIGHTVTPSAANGSVSGKITDASGSPISGVTINLGGTQTRETITDAEGNYSFDGVETNGFYTVTPSRVNYIFNPANRSFSALGVHTEASFTASANGDHANAIDTTEFFVRQQYLDFLGREPDPPGFNGWVNTLRNCAPGDASCDRIHVSEAFFRSAEFQERGYFVYRFYSSAFGRKPDYAEFMPDLGRVSGFLTNDQLEAAKTALANDFMSRPAFAAQYGGSDNPAYVDALINTAAVNLSNRQSMIDGLNAGTLTRAQVLRQIAESGEVYQKYYNQAFVVMEYFGYLRRDPDALYLNWIQVLDVNPADSRHMVSGFVNSTEYRKRFAQ
jgi:CSLREA domain-containing protein